MTESDLMKAASSRLVKLGDVEPRPGDVLHMQNIKVLTSGDEIDGMKVHTTLIMTTNELFHYEDMSDYVRPDRLRRVVVVPSVVERDGSNIDFAPLHQTSLDELVQFAVRTRIKHRRPPMKPDVLLASLFQSRYKDALEIVCIDEGAALFECMTATMLLCWRFGTEVDELSKCLKWAGCCCAVESGGVHFIAKIKPLTGKTINHIFESANDQSHSTRKYYRNADRANTPIFP